MEFKGFVIITAVVLLCSCVETVYGKLKCVQCGLTPEMIKTLSAANITKLYTTNSGKHKCSKQLPEPTECAKDDQNYCVQTKGRVRLADSVRFCSEVELHECNRGWCLRSCDVDGCNGNSRDSTSNNHIKEADNRNQTDVNQTNDNQTNDNQANDNQTNDNQTDDNQTNDNQTNDNQTNDNQTNDNQTEVQQIITNISEDVGNLKQKNLECIQCGTTTLKLMEIVFMNPEERDAVMKDPSEYTCPTVLPNATKCEDASNTYCATAVLDNITIRFCIPVNIEGCKKNAPCVISCNTNGCNNKLASDILSKFFMNPDHEKLQCVRCGMNFNLMMQMANMNPQELAEMQDTMKKDLYKYTCPEVISDATECDDIDQTFCATATMNNITIRYCSAVKAEGCEEGGPCVESCDTSGCNDKLNFSNSVYDSSKRSIDADAVSNIDTNTANKIKCVQCGVTLPEILQLIYMDPEEQQSVQDDFTIHPGKYTCPDILPEATECEDEDQKFCAKTLLHNFTIRFCSSRNLQGCRESDQCVESCDTNGCNDGPIVSRLTDDSDKSNSAIYADEGTSTTEKLKCIQCGVTLTYIMKIMYMDSKQQNEIQDDFTKNPYKYTCPDTLPEPTECEDEKHKYCVTAALYTFHIRFCSEQKIDRCEDKNQCIQSCDRNNCNNDIIEVDTSEIVTGDKPIETNTSELLSKTNHTSDALEPNPKQVNNTNLECVQCGMPITRMMKMTYLNQESAEVQKDHSNNTCPTVIPKATECDNASHAYCAIAVLHNITIRFCSGIKLTGCKPSAPCVESCDTNGCNADLVINPNNTISDNSSLNFGSFNKGGRKLKCIQCGMKPIQMMRVLIEYPKDTPALQNDLINNPDKFSCPPQLPEASECDSETEKYCIKVIQKITSARFCALISLQVCNDDLCVESCETDGCNGDELDDSNSILKFAGKALDLIVHVLFP